MITRFLQAVLLGMGIGQLSAQGVAPSFRVGFDGTLEAVARGRAVPIKIEGPVQFRPGKFGRALLCGDGGALLEYAAPGNLRMHAGTVSMWVCPVNWTGERDVFHVFLEAKSPGWLVFYRYYQGGMTMLLGRGGRNYQAIVGPRFTWKPGEWHHVAGVWRPTGIAVYLDGKRAGFKPDPPLPEKSPPVFVIGDAPWHIPRDGEQTLIDEVRIYPVPLDDEAVARLARGEDPPADWSPTPVIKLAGRPDVTTLSVLCDAAGLVGDEGPGRSAAVDLVPAGSGNTAASAVIDAFEHDMGTAVLPLENVPEGPCSVRVRICDEKGAVAAERTASFTKPVPPVWRGNRIGLEDRVLPPWTPLRQVEIGGKPAFRCWGRTYVFGPFLDSAESAGMRLLHTPVRLEAAVGGRPVDIRWTPCTVETATDTHAVLTCSGRGGGLRFDLRHRIEFDGFVWTDLTVAPEAGPVAVEALRLRWSMPASTATLIHANDAGWNKNTAGRLPGSGWKSTTRRGFTDYFWLGNERGGLAWFRESDRYWVRGSSGSALEAVPRKGNVEVTVRFIAAPVAVSAERTYGFGFMATPVRPRPADARKWRMMPGKGATFEVVWPNGNLKYYGYTEPTDPARFRQRVERAHRQGRLVVPYVNLNYVSAGVPEWLFYREIWADPGRVATPSDVMAMGFPSMGTCPASKDWQDFIIFRIKEMIRKYAVDGIYIDCWTPYPSRHPACARRDEQGNLHPVHPIRAYRQILRRVYALFRDMRPRPLLQVHMSSHMIIPMLSFTDTTLDGEQFRSSPLKDDYLDLLPPDAFRAEFMGRNWGPVAFFLPEFQKPQWRKSGTTNLAVYLLLHDVNAWPIWSDLEQWNRFYGVLDAFGIADARYVPYWAAAPSIGAPSGVLVSAFARHGRLLLAVMNTGPGQDAEIAVDAAAFGMRGLRAAEDPISGRSLLLSGNRIKIPLAAREGRLVEVTGER